MCHSTDAGDNDAIISAKPIRMWNTIYASGLGTFNFEVGEEKIAVYTYHGTSSRKKKQTGEGTPSCSLPSANFTLGPAHNSRSAIPTATQFKPQHAMHSSGPAEDCEFDSTHPECMRIE